jgi:hypothetical protein
MDTSGEPKGLFIIDKKKERKGVRSGYFNSAGHRSAVSRSGSQRLTAKEKKNELGLYCHIRK